MTLRNCRVSEMPDSGPPMQPITAFLDDAKARPGWDLLPSRKAARTWWPLAELFIPGGQLRPLA